LQTFQTNSVTSAGSKPQDNVKSGKKVEFADQVISKVIKSSDQQSVQYQQPDRPVSASILKKSDDTLLKQVTTAPPPTPPILIITEPIEDSDSNKHTLEDTNPDSISIQPTQPLNDEPEDVENDYTELENYTSLRRPSQKSNESELSSEAEAGEDGQEDDELHQPVEKPKFYRTVVAPKVYVAKYPYLEIPYDSKETIVDYSEYNKTFEVPEVLCPRVYEINASKTSIEELLLERRILEDKIIEIKERKLSRIERGGSGGRGRSDEGQRSQSSHKEKVYNEERLNLHNQALKKQLVGIISW